MEIVLSSNCVENLDSQSAATSSQIFEIEFAKALSLNGKVGMLSLQATKEEQLGNLSLFPLGDANAFTKEIKRLTAAGRLFTEDEKIIIAYGYDVRIFKKLKKVSREVKAKLVSFTFDTHKAAIEHRAGLRKMLIDMYFRLGIRNLNNIDGIILFNQAAYEEFKLDIPFAVSKVGINEQNIRPDRYTRKKDGAFNIIYAGSLEKTNGILEMIEAMKLLDSSDLALNIYGKGVLERQVIKEIAGDSRITFHGLVPKRDLEIEMAKADLLVNLRDTDHYINKFAFPSKLVEYLASGIPVLSTKLLDDEKFTGAAFVIDELTPETISETISKVIDRPEEREKRSLLAKTYVKENFLWDTIIPEVENFLKKIAVH